MTTERTDVTFGAQIADLLAGLREAQAATKESVEGMKSSMEGLNRTVEGVQKAFALFAGLMAGGELLEGIIERTAEMGQHLEVTSQKTGIAADELSRLEFAAKMSDVSAEGLTMSLTRLARGMEQAQKGTGPGAEALERLGLRATDAAGHLKPITTIVDEVADKFHGMEDGAGKTSIAMDLFGRSGAQLIPLLNQGAAGIAAFKAEADRLHITMSEDDVEAANKYVDAMKEFNATMDAAKRRVALELMPALIDIANTMKGLAASSDGAAGAMSRLGESFKTVVRLGLNAYAIVGQLTAEVKFLTTLLTTPVGPGHFVSFANTVRDAFHQMGAEVTDVDEKVLTAMQRLNGFGGEKAQKPKDESGGKGGKASAPGAIVTDKGDKDRLANAEKQWQLLRDVSSKGRDDLLQDEADYWQSQEELVTGNSKADEKLREQFELKKLAALHAIAGDEKKAAEIETQIQRDAAVEQLEVEKRAIDEKLALRQIGAEEAATQLRAIATQELDARNTAFDAELAAAQGDIVKLAQIAAQRRTSDAKYATDLQAINKATTAAIAKDWESVMASITNAIRVSFQGVMQGTQTLRDALRNLFRNITLDFIASKAEELKSHLAIELAKRGITAETALQSAAMGAWSALKNIASYAAQAAAAAWAAISAIPIVGPFLAPAVAAGALVGVLALGSKVASAAGGYDIPAGVNPMTQLHAQEMVLPAELANTVRGMAKGGAGARGGDVHLHVQAVDADSVRRLFLDHGPALADGVHQAVKMGQISAKKLGLG